MDPRTWTTTALLTALTLGISAGCGAPPKPPPPTPEKTPWEEPKGSAPDNKKCEALDEKCVAAASTKARIAKTSWTITPITGWTYAQTESATIAQTSDTGGAMVVVGYDSVSAKEDIKNREAALEAAAKEIGVTLSKKKKINWKAPIDTKEVSGIKIPLFEAEDAKRKDKVGTLLVFAATLPENKGIVGFGFVADGDKDADKIVEGLQTSIGSVAQEAAKDGKK